MTTITKPACILHPVTLNCNCTDTSEFHYKRRQIVQKLIAEFYHTHGNLPPTELIERWLGEWK
jgi:hypothetical protein